MIRLIAHVVAALAATMTVLPVATPAEEFVPRLYDVAGVAANDVLNVRAAPTVSAPIIGMLPPSETHVEVVGLNDTSKWGRIAMTERDGWVSMAYLQRRYPNDEGIPAGMRCFGTEPFWSMTFLSHEVIVRPNAGMPAYSYPVSSTRWPHWRAPSQASLYAWSGRSFGAHVAGSIEAKSCSDGMSGRPYGWQATIVHSSPGGKVSLQMGCCSLDGR